MLVLLFLLASCIFQYQQIHSGTSPLYTAVTVSDGGVMAVLIRELWGISRRRIAGELCWWQIEQGAGVGNGPG